MYSRWVSYFVAACLVVIAGCLALVMHVAGGLMRDTALLLALAFLLTGLACLTFFRLGQRFAVVEAILDDDGEAIDGLTGRANSIDERLAALEVQARQAVKPASEEVQALGELIHELAELMAAQDERIAALEREPASSSRGKAARPVQAGTETMRPPVMPTLPPERAHAGAPDLVTAIEQGALDVFLKPVVGLPDRAPRLYDAQPRLQLSDGRHVEPIDYRLKAGALGRLAGLDASLFERCAELALRLSARGRDLTIVCNVSLRSLGDGAFMDHVTRAIGVVPGLGRQIVFGVTHAALRTAGTEDRAALDRVIGAGYGILIDCGADADVDITALCHTGFRYARWRAGMITEADRSGQSAGQPSLTVRLAMAGLTLIAENVRDETQVASLVRHGIELAEGPLFGQARLMDAGAFSEAPQAGGKRPAEDADMNAVLARILREPRPGHEADSGPVAPQELRRMA